MQVIAQGVLAKWLEQDKQFALLDGPFEVSDTEVKRLKTECIVAHPDYDEEHRTAWAIFSVVTRKAVGIQQQAEIGVAAADSVSRVARSAEGVVAEFRAFRGAFEAVNSRLAESNLELNELNRAITKSGRQHEEQWKMSLAYEESGFNAVTQAIEQVQATSERQWKWTRWLLIGALALLAGLLGVAAIKAEPEPKAIYLFPRPLSIAETHPDLFALPQTAGMFIHVNLRQVGGTAVSSALYDGANTAFRVNCVTGCAAGSSFTDNTVFTGGTTAVNNMGMLFDTTPPAITDGNAGIPRMSSLRIAFTELRDQSADSAMDDANNAVRVNIVAGGGAGGTSSSFGAAFPASGTAAGFNDGVNMQGARVFDLDSGAGTQYGQGINLRKIASGGSVEAGTAADPLRVDVTGATTQPVSIAGTVTVAISQTTTNNDVDVISVVPGTGATNLGKAVDNVAGATDTGVALLAVRTDTPATLTPVSGDYVPLRVNAQGSLYTTVIGSEPVTGIIDANGETVIINASNATAIQITGTWVGQLDFEVTVDGTNYVPRNAHTGTQSVNATAVNGIFTIGAGGYDKVRVRATSWTSGAASLTLKTNAGAHPVLIYAALPTGDNNIGNVDVATLPSVTVGTFPDNEPFNVAQINGVTPLMGNGVTGTGSLRVTVASDNTAFTVNAAQSGTWNITNVSGTVSLPTGASTLAEQQTQTTALQLIDNLPLAQGSTTSGQSGILTMGAVTTGAPTYTTGQTSPLSLTTAGDLRMTCTNCSGSGATHVDNAVFTGGTDDVAPMGALFDATPPTITDGNLGAPRMDSSRNLHVNCVVGCAGGSTTPTDDFVTPTTAGLSTSFGMVYDGTTWDLMRGTSVDGVLVNLGANNDVTVTGSVTANAGTNLNTSALNLEATQADVRTSVQLIDDSVATLGTTTYTEATTKGLTIGALRRDADTSPVGTDNEIGPLTMDANGRLKVEIFDGGDSHTIDGTVTVGTFPDNEPFNVAQFGGSAVVTGAGASGSGIPRVTVSNDSSLLGTKTNNAAAPGATNFGVLGAIANASPPTYTEGNLVAASTNLKGVARTGAGFISTGNSSATPLGASATFTGTFEDVTDFSGLTLIAFANVASATDGLCFDWSSDGTNADRSECSSVVASTGRAFNISVRAQFFRVRYINGGSAQATFRLETVYCATCAGVITKPLDGSVNDENLAQSVQAALMGRKTDATYGNISSTLGATLDTNSMMMKVESYSASAVVASAASATDIAVLSGNATDTVLVTRVIVSCTQTTAGIITLNMIIRTTADTAGTSVGMTEVADDQNYAAASSAGLTYTANPTINSTVGNVDTAKFGCMATGTATPNDVYILDRRAKPIVLRGTAQQLAVNLGGVTVTGGSFSVTFEWLETASP